jgi:hypothetical protein
MRRGVAVSVAIAAGVLAATFLPASLAATPRQRLQAACDRDLDRELGRSHIPIKPPQLPGTPPASLTSMLGVLRRPATPADAPGDLGGLLFDGEYLSCT